MKIRSLALAAGLAAAANAHAYGGIGGDWSWMSCYGTVQGADKEVSVVPKAHVYGKPDHSCRDGRPRHWDRWVPVNNVYARGGKDPRDPTATIWYYAPACYKTNCPDAGRLRSYLRQYRGVDPYP